jgi:hypothetical protein
VASSLSYSATARNFMSVRWWVLGSNITKRIINTHSFTALNIEISSRSGQAFTSFVHLPTKRYSHLERYIRDVSTHSSTHLKRKENILHYFVIHVRGYIQNFPYSVDNEINTRWEATQRVMEAKLTRLAHKIAIKLHLVAESCCSSRSRWPVRKLLDTPS